MARQHDGRAEAEDGSSEQEGGESWVTGPVYQIRVKGHLNHRWSRWFDGLAITHEPDGSTLLTGAILDQPALYGLLIKLRNLGLSLLSVVREPEGRVQEDEDGHSQ
jgi:hypothetical protein